MSTGTPGNDTIVGTAGDDIIDGLGGDDQLRGQAGDDLLFGGHGADSLNGAAGNDVLQGGDGNDNLSGDLGDDVLIGGAGGDLLKGDEGLDSFDGGDGFDRLSLFHSRAVNGAIADLRTGVIQDDGFGNVETMTSIEAFAGGTRFADVFHGSDGPNQIIGGTGDTVEGHGGNDEIQVSGAPALIDGGDGVDSISRFQQFRARDLNGDGVADMEFTSSGVIVDLSRGLIVDDGFGDSGVIRNVENLGGSPFDDVLIGDRGDNVLWGALGDDVLTGGKGDDRFYFDARFGVGGQDRITDFHHRHDLIVFVGVADDFEDLVITKEGKDVRVTWGDPDASILIENTPISQITAEDFLFG